MSTKAADLKQKFSFRSLRLLEEMDTRGRSMSDSEMNKVDGSNDLKFKSKSKSDPCLNINKSLHNKYFNMKSKSNAIVDYDEASDHSQDNEPTGSFHFQNIEPSHSQVDDPLNNTQVESIDNKNQTSSISQAMSDDKMEEASKQNDGGKPNLEDRVMASDKIDGDNPYSLLEDILDPGKSSKKFLSEPRCLTLKKYTGEIDPFLNDDLLILQPDFDSFEGFSENPTETQSQSKSYAVDDMFLDEGNNCPKEEGELSPEAHQQISQSEAPDIKANIEFFYKINQCLSKLDKKCRDFHSTSLPEYCLKYLRRTLTNVDSIKRKLTYLLNSKNSDIEKKKKSSEKLTSSERKRNIRAATQQKSTETQSHSKESDREQNMLQNILNLDESRYASHSSRRRKSSREKPTQAELLNRKKMSILEKLGTKKEIERIQSLFKRQMNIINQHVIQKKETSKAKEPDKSKKVRSGDQTSDKMRQHLNKLTTLEDLENFFQTLKHKTNEKLLYQQVMEKEKNKGTLKFTSKREKNPHINPKKEMQITTAEANKRYTENTSKLVSKPDNLNKSQNKGEKEILEMRTELNKAAESEKEIEKNVTPKKLQDIPERVSNRHAETHADDRISKIAAKDVNKLKTADSEEKERHTDFDKIIQKEEIVVKDNKISFSIGKDIANKTTQRTNVSEIGNVFENNKPQVHKRKQSDELEKQVIKKKRIDKQKSRNGESHSISLKEKTSLSDKTDIIQIQEEATLKEYSSNKYQSKEKTQKVEPHEELNIQDLLRKRIMILDDHNLDPNGQFRLKIIGKEVYLEKLSNKRKHAKETKRKKEHSKDRVHPKKNCREIDHVVSEQKHITDNLVMEQENTTLEDMEHFLQELRSKRKSDSDAKQIQTNESNAQEKEMQFLSRIRAKRKAKLMAACQTDNPNSMEKEAKFLRALHTEGTSDVDKQKFMEKHKAETDAIVQKPGQTVDLEDDPLADVKSFLNMIKEAESGKEAKQECVSFALKRSDMKRLESITSGRTSSLTEESQKFLNSVRSKLKAKKLPPPSNISSLMRKPQS